MRASVGGTASRQQEQELLVTYLCDVLVHDRFEHVKLVVQLDAVV